VNVRWVQANKAHLSATVASQVDAARTGTDLLASAQRSLCKMRESYKVHARPFPGWARQKLVNAKFLCPDGLPDHVAHMCGACACGPWGGKTIIVIIITVKCRWLR
jgi:hypothetical protein